MSLQEYKQYIKSLPLQDPASLFGLHPNSEISCGIQLTDKLLEDIISILPQIKSG